MDKTRVSAEYSTKLEIIWNFMLQLRVLSFFVLLCPLSSCVTLLISTNAELGNVENWPTVTGEVYRHWEEESESKDGAVQYHYYMEYMYVIDGGGTCFSETYDMSTIGLGTSMPKGFYDAHFVGAKIQIWHHPHIHGISVLTNEVDRTSPVCLLIFFSIPAVIGVVNVRSWCKDFKLHLKKTNPEPLKSFGTGFKGITKRIVMAIISLIAITHSAAPLYLGYFEMEVLLGYFNSPFEYLTIILVIHICFWPIFLSEFYQAEV
tara:strand:+ start:507 stop:1292 length:786 start_codon:yes stop_codon:yes gene_type:complete